MCAARRFPKHLHDVLGTAAAEDLVTIIDEIRADHERQMQATKSWIDARFDALDSRLDGVEKRLDKMDGRFQRIEERIGIVEVKLGDVKADLMKWSFVFWVGAVTAIAVLAGVLDR